MIYAKTRRLAFHLAVGVILVPVSVFIGVLSGAPIFPPALLILFVPIKAVMMFAWPAALGTIGFLPVVSTLAEAGLVNPRILPRLSGAFGAIVMAAFLIWHEAHHPGYPTYRNCPVCDYLVAGYATLWYSVGGFGSGFACAKLSQRIARWWERRSSASAPDGPTSAPDT